MINEENKPLTIKCCRIVGDSKDVPGSVSVFVGYVSNQEEAVKFVTDARFSKHCFMGVVPSHFDARRYIQEVEIQIHMDAESLYSADIEKIRERARQKLTPEELAALGL